MFAKAAHRLLQVLLGPRIEAFEHRQEPGDHGPSVGREQRRRLVLELDRPLGMEVASGIDELDQGLGALFQARHRVEQLLPQFRGELGGKLLAPGNMRQDTLDLGEELGVGRLAHVMAVEVFELGKIEPRRRAADLRQLERRDHLLGRKHLLVAVAPAEPDEVIAHGGRQIAHGPIGIDAERAVALGELGAVGPVEERDVGHRRHRPAQRLVDLLLPRRIGEVIVATDDVGHVHVVVVDHDREHVGRGLVGAQQHQVVEVLVLPDHATLDLILDDGLALGRRLEADDRLDAGRRLFRIAVAPAAVVELRASFAPRGFAHFCELLGTRVTVIGFAGGKQRFRDLAVARGAGELRDRLAVPVEAEPGQPVEDRRDRGLGRALAVGILDAQQHLAAASARIEPIEQRRACAADVQEAGRGGREAGDDGFSHVDGQDRRRATTTSGDVPRLSTPAKTRGRNKGGPSRRAAVKLADRRRHGAAQQGSA